MNQVTALKSFRKVFLLTIQIFEELEKEKLNNAARMSRDNELVKVAADLIAKFSRYKYAYFFSSGYRYK